MNKIVSITFSLLFIGVLAFAVTWGVINFNQVKTGMASTGVYTNEDLTKSYEDGYSTALTDKAEYEDLINGYRDTIISLNDNISQLNTHVNYLVSDNQDYSVQVENLTEQRIALEDQVQRLSQDKEKNEATIQTLNNVIYNLNKQISEMSALSQNHTAQIKALNNRINELQTSITYYENYIANLENEQKAVLTFEYDNSVYNLQVVNKGTRLAIADPVSTETKIFNGWKINNNMIDKETYIVNESTKLVADITYKYPVKFMVDYEQYNCEYVVKDSTVTLPANPYKEGFEFLGWSLNGIDTVSNIENTPVNEETTYYAIFVKLHTVNFVVDEQIVSTQIISDGNCANNVSVEITGQFKGWKLNDILTDPTTYPVYNDVTFVADILKQNWVSSGMKTEKSIYGSNVWTDGTNLYYSNYVSKKSGQVHLMLDRSTGVWNPITWNGIDSIQFKGEDVWTDGNNVYYSQGTNHFVLNKSTRTWTATNWSTRPWYGNNIWTDGTNIYYNNGSDPALMFNKGSNSWSVIQWNGLSSFTGENVWQDNEGNYYYSTSSDTYILNKQTRTWTPLNWNTSNIIGQKVWRDGKNVYCLKTGVYYLLDTKNRTCTEIQMIGGPTGTSSVEGWNVWYDSGNVYYSFGTKIYQFCGWVG